MTLVVAEKGEGEVRLPSDAREAPVRRVTQPGEALGADVGQFAPLDVAPHLFDGVQLRSVPGQRFDRQPRALAAEIGPHGPALVGAKPVPEEHHAPAPKVPLELPQEGDQRHGGGAPRARLEVEARAPRVPVERQRPGHREALPGGPRVGQDGGLPARRPGAPDDGLLRDATFVIEDELGSLAAGVCFTAGQRCRTHCRIAPSSCSRARRAGRCSDHCSPRKRYQTWPG
jgi:hypothetical protein